MAFQGSFDEPSEASSPPPNLRVTFKDKQRFVGFQVGQKVISDDVPVLDEAEFQNQCSRTAQLHGNQSKPQFITSFHYERADSYRQFVAKNQANLTGKYVAPSEHSFRDECLEKHVGGQFVTKFHLPNNQNVRRDAAINQANFFALEKPIPEYIPASVELASRPEFFTKMPNTSSKWANTELRTSIAKDQAGMFPRTTEESLRNGGNTVVLVKQTPKEVQLSGKRFELLSAGERSLNTPVFRNVDLAAKDFVFLP